MIMVERRMERRFVIMKERRVYRVGLVGVDVVVLVCVTLGSCRRENLRLHPQLQHLYSSHQARNCSLHQ